MNTKKQKASHHCLGCKETFRSRCVKKAHMVECPVHPGLYSLPTEECVRCVEIEESEERRQREEKKKEEKKGDKKKDDKKKDDKKKK
ncbi:hypothetical protein F5Y10DRAFT_272831 [Nemania abortiva]|nr:hypothetical protein F5Y10DRAFT_272831 [Nemania abortiva]